LNSFYKLYAPDESHKEVPTTLETAKVEVG